MNRYHGDRAVGELYFYDWEANVIGPAGRPAPQDQSVTGGLSAGQAGSLDQYTAVLRAGKVASFGWEPCPLDDAWELQRRRTAE